MAELALIATVASAAVSAVGTIAAGQAAKEQGLAQQQVANWEAKQMEVNATEEKAAGQQQMLQLRRQKNLALSSLQAKSSSDGFSATDPTALALADEISTYGTVQEQMALYGGASRESDLRMGATGRRVSGAMAADVGRAKQTASYFDAGSTILGGIGSMGQKYGKTAYKPTTTGRYG